MLCVRRVWTSAAASSSVVNTIQCSSGYREVVLASDERAPAKRARGTDLRTHPAVSTLLRSVIRFRRGRLVNLYNAVRLHPPAGTSRHQVVPLASGGSPRQFYL